MVLGHCQRMIGKYLTVLDQFLQHIPSGTMGVFHLDLSYVRLGERWGINTEDSTPRGLIDKLIPTRSCPSCDQCFPWGGSRVKLTKFIILHLLFKVVVFTQLYQEGQAKFILIIL